MLLGTVVSYFLMDLQGNFIYLVLISWGLGLSSCSIAMGLGCLVPDVKNVGELVPLAYTPQMMFAGFFIRISQIPVFLRWARYLCGIKYAISLAIIVELTQVAINVMSVQMRERIVKICSVQMIFTQRMYGFIFFCCLSYLQVFES